METLKKYWWLVLLIPVVLYMVYVLTKESKGKPKPGSPEYAREAKAAKAALKGLEDSNTAENGGVNSESQTV